MVNCQEKALENMKLGLYDVLPTTCLEGLTPEDFRLLVNGVSDIHVTLRYDFVKGLLILHSASSPIS